MAQGQRTDPPVSADMHREGGRWIGERPTPEEFGEWFRKNVQLDDGLDAEKYVGGMTLIPAEEKFKYTAVGANNQPVISEKKHLVFTPYPRVSARVSYWWDLLEQHEDWIGVISPVEAPRSEDESAIGKINRTLPPGFWMLPVPVGEGYSHFLCNTVEVKIYEKPIEWVEVDRLVKVPGELRIVKERIPSSPPIRSGRGTKQVALTKRYGGNVYADDSSIMKCETGALGRALAAAGILTVGSGLASAEDITEGFGAPTPVEAQGPVETLPEIPQGQLSLPEATTGAEQKQQTREQSIEQAKAILENLNSQFPEAYQEFTAWAQAQDPPVRDISALSDPALRGCVKKLAKILENAKAAQARAEAQDESAEAPDA